MPSYDDSRYQFDTSGLSYDGNFVVPVQSGTQPYPTGQLGAVAQHKQSLASTQPAATATLVYRRTTFRASLTGAQPSGAATFAYRKGRYVHLEGVQPQIPVAVYDDVRLTYNSPIAYDASLISALSWKVNRKNQLSGIQDAPSGELRVRVAYKAHLTGQQDSASGGDGTGETVSWQRVYILGGTQPISSEILYDDPRFTYEERGLAYEDGSPGILQWRMDLDRLLEGETPAPWGELTVVRIMSPWAQYWPSVYDRPESVVYTASLDADDLTVRYQTRTSAGVVYREIAPRQGKELRR